MTIRNNGLTVPLSFLPFHAILFFYCHFLWEHIVVCLYFHSELGSYLKLELLGVWHNKQFFFILKTPCASIACYCICETSGAKRWLTVGLGTLRGMRSLLYPNQWALPSASATAPDGLESQLALWTHLGLGKRAQRKGAEKLSAFLCANG